MAALDRGLRRELGRAVQKARKIAESGARAALGALMVGEEEADASVIGSDRDLRRQLRAHGRQLGDQRTGKKQELTRLAREVAYEHWHRMLFARFLAENGLLIEPETGVAVSLEDCRELARGQKKDPWALASGFAAAMLPQIFRADDPSLAVSLPPETRRSLEKTLAGLPPPVFHADDALGWTYQYWQTDRKNEVNASEAKIGADELPAVTQLFTEPYMVRFLFHNTVGAWRAGRLLAEQPDLAENAENEDELRRAFRLEAGGGYDFDYLRFVREEAEDGNDPSGRWRPAAGSYERWPTRAADLRVLDPCCGSGHFLVEGLHLFVRLRMEEEDIQVEEAISAVLRDNLHGLEIDPRCAQIAAFSVAFAAWKLAGGVTGLPPLRIACSGLAPNATKEQWIALAGHAASDAGSGPERRPTSPGTPALGALQQTLGALHNLFARGPTLGSLIDPRRSDAGMFAAEFDAVRDLLDSILEDRETDVEGRERAVAAAGTAEAAVLLAETYTLVITNVPYLGTNDHDDILRAFAAGYYAKSKHNLATMFFERSFRWLTPVGTGALVVPQNWLSLPRYRRLREESLSHRRWRFVARLGAGAFEAISGHVVSVAMPIISADEPEQDWHMAGIDVSASQHKRPTKPPEKAATLCGHPSSASDEGGTHVVMIRQSDQLSTPDSRVLFQPLPLGVHLSTVAWSRTGLWTSDNASLLFCHWETSVKSQTWRLCQSSVATNKDWWGCEKALRWEDGQGLFHQYAAVGGRSIQGQDAWGKRGVLVSLMASLPATLYTGAPFDNNAGVVMAKSNEDIAALWVYLASPEYANTLRIIERSLKLTTATLLKVPADWNRWRTVAAEKYPNGLPEPYSNDPRQWIFHGHPCGSVVWDENGKRTANGALRADATVLQVAVARLLGYRWPAERDPDMRLADEQRAWVDRCAALDELADEDGIVCLPTVRGEASAAERVRAVLAASYGDEWDPTNERRLLRAAAESGRTADNLDEWLRRDFFKAHCSMFRQRPFVWHIWDGLPDGFQALVNFHRLTGPDGEGRRTLESLAFSYLGDWIARQRAAHRDEVAGAEAKLAAALDLQQQLLAILVGKPPLDLFVRWKPLHRQALGWEPDLDDGVRLNIRPFLRAKIRRGLKDAGVLRAKPKIVWGKDKGKEPHILRVRGAGDGSEDRRRADFPWFWTCPGNGTEAERTDFLGSPAFDGNRWNDLHYTLDAKRDARARHERDSRAAASGAEDSAGTTGDHEGREAS